MATDDTKKTTKKKILAEASSDNPKVQEELEKTKKEKFKKKVFTQEELDAPRTSQQFRLALRRKMRIYYDIQELKIQTLGRLTKKAEGAQIELHPRDLMKLQARLEDLEVAENNALKDLAEQLHEVPFYREVIEPGRKGQFRGLGPRMASVIIASFDIEREVTVSQMWAFAGLAPIPATRCKDCSVVVTLIENKEAIDITDVRSDHDTPVAVYKHTKPAGCTCKFAGGMISASQTFASGKQMRPVAGEKLRYNAWLRTKLCGVLATVLLQVGSPYRRYYDNRKQYNVSRNWGTSDMHRNRDAMRYMIKMLLLDIWKLWRAFEGLPVRPSYAEEKLGHVTSMKPISEITDGLDPVDAALVNDVLEEEAGAA